MTMNYLAAVIIILINCILCHCADEAAADRNKRSSSLHGFQYNGDSAVDGDWEKRSMSMLRMGKRPAERSMSMLRMGRAGMDEDVKRSMSMLRMGRSPDEDVKRSMSMLRMGRAGVADKRSMSMLRMGRSPDEDVKRSMSMLRMGRSSGQGHDEDKRSMSMLRMG